MLERRIIGAQRSGTAESQGAEVGEYEQETWSFPMHNGLHSGCVEEDKRGGRGAHSAIPSFTLSPLGNMSRPRRRKPRQEHSTPPSLGKHRGGEWERWCVVHASCTDRRWSTFGERMRFGRRVVICTACVDKGSEGETLWIVQESRFP